MTKNLVWVRSSTSITLPVWLLTVLRGCSVSQLEGETRVKVILCYPCAWYTTWMAEAKGLIRRVTSSGILTTILFCSFEISGVHRIIQAVCCLHWSAVDGSSPQSTITLSDINKEINFNSHSRFPAAHILAFTVLSFRSFFFPFTNLWKWQSKNT